MRCAMAVCDVCEPVPTMICACDESIEMNVSLQDPYHRPNTVSASDGHVVPVVDLRLVERDHGQVAHGQRLVPVVLNESRAVRALVTRVKR
jgi:hypothetical protein